MQYISADEFLKQLKKVQEIFLNWWQPSVGDIYCNLYNGQEDNVLVINQCQFGFKSFKDDIKQYGIPLLTEGQLREFIEDKMGYKMLTDIEGYYKQYKIFFIDDKGKYHSPIDNLGDDLLQAYWKLACEIAEVNK